MGLFKSAQEELRLFKKAIVTFKGMIVAVSNHEEVKEKVGELVQKLKFAKDQRQVNQEQLLTLCHKNLGVKLGKNKISQFHRAATCSVNEPPMRFEAVKLIALYYLVGEIDGFEEFMKMLKKYKYTKEKVGSIPILGVCTKEECFVPSKAQNLRNIVGKCFEKAKKSTVFSFPSSHFLRSMGDDVFKNALEAGIDIHIFLSGRWEVEEEKECLLDALSHLLKDSYSYPGTLWVYQSNDANVPTTLVADWFNPKSYLIVKQQGQFVGHSAHGKIAHSVLNSLSKIRASSDTLFTGPINSLDRWSEAIPRRG